MIQYIQYTIQEINRTPSITTNQVLTVFTFDIFFKHFLFVKVLPPFFSHAIGTPSSSESVRRLADLRYKDHRLQALQPLQAILAILRGFGLSMVELRQRNGDQVSTIDALQGGECDLLIFSATRSNTAGVQLST